MGRNLAKIAAVAFGTVGLLAGAGTANAQSSASQQITIRILPFRRLYVNEDNQIIGVAQMADQSYDDTDVFKNEVEMPMTADIQSQYLLLQDPAIANKLGINWTDNHFWYKPIDPSVFDSLQETFLQKTLENTVKDNLSYSINGNRKVSVNYSTPNTVMYTITEQ